MGHPISWQFGIDDGRFALHSDESSEIASLPAAMGYHLFGNGNHYLLSREGNIEYIVIPCLSDGSPGAYEFSNNNYCVDEFGMLAWITPGTPCQMVQLSGVTGFGGNCPLFCVRF